MSHLERFQEDCRQVRAASPLVHNITNYVAMSISANALLAAGASPLMSFEPDEMEEIVTISSALVINIGCLDKVQIEAMRIAAATAHRLGKPWVLDPVGAGASRLRTQTCLELAERFHPTVIRGNASEIMALAGAAVRSRGVDSSEESLTAVEYARKLARTYSTIVSVSGPVDYITDGDDVVSLSNGSPMMPAVTAMGCTASALTGAFLAVDPDPFSAACCTMALMGVAGEVAARGCAGPGTLALNFIDTLATIDPDEAYKLIRR